MKWKIFEVGCCVFLVGMVSVVVADLIFMWSDYNDTSWRVLLGFCAVGFAVVYVKNVLQGWVLDRWLKVFTKMLESE